MTSTIRQRIPWSSANSSAISEGVAEESIPLLEIGAEDAAATAAFGGIEEAGAALDATGVGAPIGITIGALAALGYGGYEIYEHLIKSHPNITPHTVNRHLQNKQGNKQGKLLLKDKLSQNKNEIPRGYEDYNKPTEEQLENSYKSRGLVPPPFKYLGPGNSLNRGKPYNKIDADARQHDLEYNKSSNKEDIYNSDRNFLSKASDHIVEGISGKGTISDTIGAIVGGAGIGVKHLAEKSIGRTLYPKDKSQRGPSEAKKPRIAEASSSQDHNTQHSVSSSVSYRTASRQNSSDLSVSSSGQIREERGNQVLQEVDMGLPGTGMGQGGSGDGNASPGDDIYTIERPLSMFDTKISTYRKVHRVMSYGIAHSFIDKAIGSGATIENQRFLTTPLASIPWDIPSFYLNPSEYGLLPNGSHVAEVRIKIYHRGVRIAFPTASTATNLATLNQVQNLQVAEALNKTGWGSDVTYTTFDTTQPMICTDLNPSRMNIEDLVPLLYGLNQNDTVFSGRVPNHQVGYKYSLPYYFCMTTSVAQTGGMPCLAENIRFYDGKTTINQCIYEKHWKPKIAPLKTPLKYWRTALPGLLNGSEPIIQCNGSLVQGHSVRITNTVTDSNGMASVGVDVPGQFQNITQPAFSINMPIEKSQSWRTGQWGQNQDIDIQPSIHVGIQAVPALTTTGFGAIHSFTDAQSDFDIVAEMDVVEHLPTKLPYATQANVPFGDVLNRYTSTIPSSDGATYGGLYTNLGIRTT